MNSLCYAGCDGRHQRASDGIEWWTKHTHSNVRYRDAERRSSRGGAHADTGPVGARNSSSPTHGIASIYVLCNIIVNRAIGYLLTGCQEPMPKSLETEARTRTKLEGSHASARWSEELVDSQKSEELGDTSMSCNPNRSETEAWKSCTNRRSGAEGG